MHFIRSMFAIAILSAFTFNAHATGANTMNEMPEPTPDETAAEMGVPSDYQNMLWSVANPHVEIFVSKTDQTMTVVVDGQTLYYWSVSTAGGGYYTPTGTWQPYSLQKMHYSKKYHNSPMPHSIFFLGGYAIHGTEYPQHLGRPASHGCVRLLKANAKVLFALVAQYGMETTTVTIY